MWLESELKEGAANKGDQQKLAPGFRVREIWRDGERGLYGKTGLFAFIRFREQDNPSSLWWEETSSNFR